ncbi:hypothetical protein JOD57_002015 [Geodermatophilus bullaregiensis]|uniref:DUF2975 domain-containing protein n=1 Tax=Geodermatophilus bullaregiensis TaxID=1564160 RepID=UPI0019565523|nr:DUF2975 domain-containing protein [Geodermatophilus bullaregiensis]MBM7806178.1 hypothetical protein [Geodermatophilus bullaregiensis]
MPSMPRVFLALRVLLALLFAALVAAQVGALPAALRHLAEESPELAGLRWPLLTFGVLELVCAQVVVVCTWRLLGMVEDDRIFREESSVWVDAIVRAIVVAGLLLSGAAVYTAVGRAPAGLPALLLVLLVVVAAVGLLVVVMRALLRRATTLQADMEAVI